MSNNGYYRAKIDDTHRLLFKPIQYQQQTHLLLLEVIRHHQYDKSRFLRGATLQETHIESVADMSIQQEDQIKFLGTGLEKVHYLDRFIVFDEIQNNIFHYDLPLILIGSAGSGKTSLTLEKMKTIPGELLYVSLSPWLVNNAKQLYYANHYQNSNQTIDFLSFEELIETIAIPQGQEINAVSFLNWHQKQKKTSQLNDGRKLYEEFRGVIAGSEPHAPYLSEQDYLNLGIRQSIYADTERQEVYRLFQNYVAFLNEGQYFDTNILSYHYKLKANSRYDAVIIDEVQDFTSSQISLVLAMLKSSSQFFMCGDANQIVHPNFFSWSGLKQLFYNSEELATHDITRILTRNYRNTPEVTELANRILKIKNARFGSIDKESHYLIESQSTHRGDVACIKSSPEKIDDINTKIRRSISFAIITLTEKLKEEARTLFDTPLVFTVQEAKGLEYENVILYHFIDQEPRFLEIAKGLTPEVLEQTFKYGRAKNKADKSMEVYKFYINSLYVGITRAIKSVYLVEKNPEHPLIHLLNINEINHTIQMDIVESSIEDWQKEASRLKSQGKLEQAQAIQDNILKQKTPSWKIFDKQTYLQLLDTIALKSDKKTLIDLFEIALLYDDTPTLQTLRQNGFRPAENLKKSYPIMFGKHFQKYMTKNIQGALKDIQMYGVDHRTFMNFTPLMAAIFTGNLFLVQKILEIGPSFDAKDSLSRTPLQIALYQTVNNPKNFVPLLESIYSQLAAESISLDVDGQLVKIDLSRAEFTLFYMILTFYRIIVSVEYINHQLIWKNGFSAEQLCNLFEAIPHSVWPEYRKKQSYLSGLLSRNEINSKYIPNRKLFQRIARGIYIINPKLKIKTANGWESTTPYALPLSISNS